MLQWNHTVEPKRNKAQQHIAYISLDALYCIIKTKMSFLFQYIQGPSLI